MLIVNTLADYLPIGIIERYRIFNCLCVGGVLSFCGLIIQQVTKNALSEPYISGIAPAALLGYILGSLVFVEHFQVLPYALSALFTCVYALFIYRSKSNNTYTTLIAGILLGGLSLSITNLIIYFYPSSSANTILYASLQSKLDATSPTIAIWLFAIVFVLSCLLDTVIKSTMLGLMIDREKAESLGIRHATIKAGLMLVISILTSLVTIEYGFLSFIGLIVPNMVRLFLGNTNRFFYILNALLGGVLLLSLDGVGRLLHPPYGIPVGLLTPILGLPLLLYLLTKQRELLV
jgi:iron complex transport system permease protein